MKSRLEKLLATLEQELARAEELADSDNETTATRYADATEGLEAAIEALGEAISALEVAA